MKRLKGNKNMELAKRFFSSLSDFSDFSKGVETLSTLGVLWTVCTLVYRTILKFKYYDYAIFSAMAVLYYLLQERYHVVPPHQVPVRMNSKSTKNIQFNKTNVYSESREAQKQEGLSNRKKKQSKGKNVHLDNSEVQKKENFSKMESKQRKELSEKSMVEAQMSGMEYPSGYFDMCKYFDEEKDDAARDKKVRLACKLADYAFDLDKVIDAAKVCDDFDTATHYLMQKCDSCGKFFSLPEIVQMFVCLHKFCKGCIKHHIAKAMKGRNILNCTCKVCEMPKFEYEDEAIEYLSTLDRYLESILPHEMHQQFHQEFTSGTWKTRLKVKESQSSSQYESNASWQTVPTRQRGNSPAQSTGPVTRSQTRAAKNSSMASLTTTQFEESIVSTADNNQEWPKLGSRFNKNSTDLPLLGNDSSCSFCTMKPGSVLQLYNMICCEHKLCRFCTTECFSQKLLKEDITGCVCPVCCKPKFHSQEDFINYFVEFRRNISYILDAGSQQLLERKFKDYIEKNNEDYGTCAKSYASVKSNERDNCNQSQRSCLHKKTPQVAPFKLLCEHARCVDCLKEAISSENVLEFVCDICYKGNREDQLEIMNNDKGFHFRLKEAVGSDIYQIFAKCLDSKIEEKESTSKFSPVISSRLSLNDYVEKRQTTCPICRNHCDLTRQLNKWIMCHQCTANFCGTCKAYFHNRCEKGFLCFKTGFHLHHQEVCFSKKQKFGIEKLKQILKANKVDFVDTEPKSGVCLLREVYKCSSKPFRSDLCIYHYQDYLTNLILQRNLKT